MPLKTELCRRTVCEYAFFTPRELDDEAEISFAFCIEPDDSSCFIHMDGAVPIVSAVVNRQVEAALAISIWIDDEGAHALQTRAVDRGCIGGDTERNDGTFTNEDRVVVEAVGLGDRFSRGIGLTVEEIHPFAIVGESKADAGILACDGFYKDVVADLMTFLRRVGVFQQRTAMQMGIDYSGEHVGS